MRSGRQNLEYSLKSLDERGRELLDESQRKMDHQELFLSFWLGSGGGGWGDTHMDMRNLTLFIHDWDTDKGRKDKRKQGLIGESIKERSEAKIKEIALIRRQLIL